MCGGFGFVTVVTLKRLEILLTTAMVTCGLDDDVDDVQGIKPGVLGHKIDEVKAAGLETLSFWN